MSDRRAKAWALLGGAAFVAAAVLVHAPPARAQSPDELKAARELFQEAYKDEQEKRLDAALDKFQRVAKVRESASVRYRIASVLESLGRLREARDAFRTLAASKPTLAPNEKEIATSAEERAKALDAKIPTLTLQMQGTPPPDLKVTVDGKDVPADTLAQPQPLEPGEHVVTATGSGMTPFESRVRLSEGGGVSLTVPVSARPATGGTGDPNGGTGNPNGGDAGNGAGSSNRTLGIVGLAAGGVLLVTSGILLAVREGDISTLNEECPNGRCPRSSQSELEGTRDQAKLFGPLGVGLGIVGLGAAGFGAYMLLKGDAPAAAAPAPTTSGLRVRVSASPIAGGGAAVAWGTF